MDCFSSSVRCARYAQFITLPFSLALKFALRSVKNARRVSLARNLTRHVKIIALSSLPPEADGVASESVGWRENQLPSMKMSVALWIVSFALCLVFPGQ